MAKVDKSNAIEILQQTVRENPNLWETRKKTAKLLFEEERYLEAAETVWGAPEIPSTDTDIAFAISIIARKKPNRAIRLIYEVIRRNHDKPEKNMAVAKCLNELGLYMEAARFYGAALAHNSALFDLGFERQMLWSDDSGKLIKAWRKSDQDSKPPLDVKAQKLSGLVKPAVIPEDPLVEAYKDAGATPPEQDKSATPAIPAAQAIPGTPATPGTPPPAPAAPAAGGQIPPPPPVTMPLSTPALGATGPLQPPAPASNPGVAASAAPGQAPAPAPALRKVGSQPLATPGAPAPGASPVKTQPLLMPGAGAPRRTLTQPLLTPGAGAPRKILTQPLVNPGAAAPKKVLTQPLAASPTLKKILTQPLATPGVSVPAAQPPSASGAPAPRQILTQPLLPPQAVPAPPNANALPPASPLPQPPAPPQAPSE